MAVIDSDAHVLETEHTWDYMLESERSLKPRIVATPNDPTSGGESWLIDGLYIDIQVLYPTFCLRPFTRRPDVEFALARSYNRWLIDIWKVAPERLRWVALLPL